MDTKNENRIRKFITEIDESTGEILKDYNRLIIDDGLVVVENENNFTKVFGKELMKYTDKLEKMDALVMMCLINNVSYETCMLTKTGTNDTRYILTHTDIENITGLSKSTIMRVMNRLVKVGLLARVKFKNSYIYYANPFVFLKGHRISKAIYDIFNKK